MKILIAIPSCHAHTNRMALQREMCFSELPAGVDYKYFLGAGGTGSPQADEVWLDCPDGYIELPEKNQRMFAWARSNGYDYSLRLDTDTFVRTDRLLTSGFEQHDYTGLIVGNFPYAAGAAVWLSARAMDLCINAELPTPTKAPILWQWFRDDFWIGGVLADNGILVVNDPRYVVDFGHCLPDFVTCHIPGALSEPARRKLMQELSRPV